MIFHFRFHSEIIIFPWSFSTWWIKIGRRKKVKDTHTRSERVDEKKEEKSGNARRKNKFRTIKGSEMGERERREA